MLPALGTQFEIINNQGTDPVAGTFAGLPEGAFLTAGGQTFKITYHGGDGNDVVLTRANPPMTITWIGQDPNNNDGHPADLTDANNWVGGVVPGPNDTALFTHGYLSNPQVSSGQNVTLYNADFDPTWGGSLSFAGGLTLAGQTHWSSGTLSGAFVAPAVGGEVSNTGTLTVDGGVSINQGPLYNAGTLVLAGTGNVYASYYVYSGNTMPGLANGHNGLIDFQGDGGTISGPIDYYSTAADVANAGTIRKSAGTGTAQISGTFSDAGGLIDAESGTLNINQIGIGLPADIFQQTTFTAAAGRRSMRWGFIPARSAAPGPASSA